ncbi:hypothetical protein CONPUDRAFT_85351 [Coniophora puteana RWD-64-598 SS2]|uniref:Fungal-type protein kinase domain-containing protein n=1 Tax=Coniophora puteana (strain RWD-64-598) TaxID=741705 RepID=A0A5M3M960_CONPW|nr:uncharacterized protein CONPUDRAFT_85351 [Coniophora puteana RWD-64-598 SS2]EIW75617.1 hypothetical protein CONPUDRAFT_85351 [Coniophora puteana RWD-64-598 SS2]
MSEADLDVFHDARSSSQFSLATSLIAEGDTYRGAYRRRRRTRSSSDGSDLASPVVEPSCGTFGLSEDLSFRMAEGYSDSKLTKLRHAFGRLGRAPARPLEPVGEPLDTASGPHALLEAVVHAMLGHYTLFRAGVLHRDVSPENIHILKKKTMRTPVTDLLIARDVLECAGILSDSNSKSIDWRRTKKSHNFRLVHPTYASDLVLEYHEGTSRTPHTALDDLESFVWTLLGALLHIVTSPKYRRPIAAPGALDAERRWLDDLERTTPTFHSPRAFVISAIYFAAEQRAASGGAVRTCAAGVAALAPVLSKWAGIMEDARAWQREFFAVQKRDVVKDQEEYEDVCGGFYRRYLVVAAEHLAGMGKETWDEVEGVAM